MADDSKLWGVIANFGWLGGLIAYLVKKDDPFVKFHAVQSILLSIIVIVASVVTFGIGGILVLLHFFCMWKAWQGEKYKLPAIGDMAEQYSK